MFRAAISESGLRVIYYTYKFVIVSNSTVIATSVVISFLILPHGAHLSRSIGVIAVEYNLAEFERETLKHFRDKRN